MRIAKAKQKAIEDKERELREARRQRAVEQHEINVALAAKQEAEREAERQRREDNLSSSLPVKVVDKALDKIGNEKLSTAGDTITKEVVKSIAAGKPPAPKVIVGAIKGLFKKK